MRFQDAELRGLIAVAGVVGGTLWGGEEAFEYYLLCRSPGMGFEIWSGTRLLLVAIQFVVT
jgi:hypothetical protein